MSIADFFIESGLGGMMEMGYDVYAPQYDESDDETGSAGKAFFSLNRVSKPAENSGEAGSWGTTEFHLSIKVESNEVGVSREAFASLFDTRVYFPEGSNRANVAVASDTTNYDSARSIRDLVTHLCLENGEDFSAMQMDVCYDAASDLRRQGMTPFGNVRKGIDKKVWRRESSTAKDAYEAWEARERKRKDEAIAARALLERVYCRGRERWDGQDVFSEASSDTDTDATAAVVAAAESAGGSGKSAETDAATKSDDKSKEGVKPKRRHTYVRAAKGIIFGGKDHALPNLTSLRMHFVGLERLGLTQRHFPKLRTLTLEQMNEVREIRFALPSSLEVLAMDHLYSVNRVDLARSISACGSLKKIVLCKNYGLGKLPPLYLPECEEIYCYRSDDLENFEVFAPKLTEARCTLDGAEGWTAWAARATRGAVPRERHCRVHTDIEEFEKSFCKELNGEAAEAFKFKSLCVANHRWAEELDAESEWLLKDMWKHHTYYRTKQFRRHFPGPSMFETACGMGYSSESADERDGKLEGREEGDRPAKRQKMD